MLLTITTTHRPATDLGYLLHKNPARVQSFSLGFGNAHVFYPVAAHERCTAALMLEIDPVGLVRGGKGFASMEQYVNDRPWVASSFLSVAIAQVFGSAVAGRSRDRPDLAASAIPLEASLAVLRCHGGEDLLRRLFEPLGYALALTRHPLDPAFPQWGDSAYFSATLSATTRLADLLRHIYVLLPVLDDRKHYWVGEAEVEKLLRQGAGWLGGHPEKGLIARRYLRHQRELANSALAQLMADEDADVDASARARDAEELQVEERIGLNELRRGAVVAALRASGAKRVIDLGCGEGELLRTLIDDPQFTGITGMDVSIRALERARERLRLDRMPDAQKGRIHLIHGSLMYRDARLEGFDAAAVVEVIEHLDPPRLRAFERVLFEFARPHTVVITTPNREYNVHWASLPAGTLRHRDHRFEWTRAEFHLWAREVAERSGYDVRFLPVGPEDPALGSPTQMGVFSVR